MERLSKSLSCGILAGVAVVLAVVYLDAGADSGLPLVQRTPAAWAAMWPLLVWERLLDEGAAFVATGLTQVTIFSAAMHAYFSGRERRNRLR